MSANNEDKSDDEALREAFRRIGDVPSAFYAMRRPATAEEAARWKAEGVIVNPSSHDAVIEEAHRRYARDKAATPSPEGSGTAALEKAGGHDGASRDVPAPDRASPRPRSARQTPVPSPKSEYLSTGKS